MGSARTQKPKRGRDVRWDAKNQEQEALHIHTSPCLRKNTSWNCGDEGRNGHRMVSTGRKGAVGSSHPCPPTTRTPKIQKKTARLNL